MGRSYSVDGVCGTKDGIIYDRALDMFDMLFSQTAAGLGQQSVSCVFFLSAPPLLCWFKWWQAPVTHQQHYRQYQERPRKQVM